MPRLPNCFASSFAGVLVLLRDQPVEHLDDRHLAAEGLEDRRELAADDPAAEHDEPPRHLGLRQQAGRVDAEVGVEPVDRRPHRERARRDDRRAERDVLPALDRDRVRVRERARALDPLDAVDLEERRDAAGHLLDDGVLPLVRLAEVELRLGDLDAELPERLAPLVEEVRGLHPRLRRHAADAQARAAELGLLLDADDLRAELRRPDRSRVAAGPAAQNGDVTVHVASSRRSLSRDANRAGFPGRRAGRRRRGTRAPPSASRRTTTRPPRRSSLGEAEHQ